MRGPPRRRRLWCGLGCCFFQHQRRKCAAWLATALRNSSRSFALRSAKGRVRGRRLLFFFLFFGTLLGWLEVDRRKRSEKKADDADLLKSSYCNEPLEQGRRSGSAHRSAHPRCSSWPGRRRWLADGACTAAPTEFPRTSATTRRRFVCQRTRRCRASIQRRSKRHIVGSL